MKILLFTIFLVYSPMIVYAAEGQSMLKGTAVNSIISGYVTLTEQKDGILLIANVENVVPGKHGFHIHEHGNCAEMGKAAGGHFNPNQMKHGFILNSGKPAHVGDMGNITVNKYGKGRLIIFLPGLSLNNGTYAVIGKSIILHEKKDDFSQPTGNAGGRIACGIIE